MKSLAFLIALPTICGQEKPSEGNSWAPWFTIPADQEPAQSPVGWIRPPQGLEFDTKHPVRVLLKPKWGIVDGRLFLLRGAVIEAWDLKMKKLLWKLASATGSFGWTLAGSRVMRVLPGSPADRAGIVRGDVITALNGKDISSNAYWEFRRNRKGQQLNLTVASAGGQRSVTLEAGPAPEPFGRIPEPLGLLGEHRGLLLKRDGHVERIRLSDGQVEWSRPGEVLAQKKSGIMVGSRQGRLISLISPEGELRWERQIEGGGAVSEAYFTSQGPLVVIRDYDAFYNAADIHFERLDPETGRTAWGYVAGRVTDPGVGLLLRGRVVIVVRDPDCRPFSNWGEGVPVHDGPTCKTYSVLDLSSGERLWIRRTGGRRHGGNKIIPFDPHHGGPAAAVGNRLFWFDVKSEVLSVFDAATLRETRKIPIPGARSFSPFSPPGVLGVYRHGNVTWLDPESGKLVDSDLVLDIYTNRVVSKRRFFVELERAKGSSGEVRSYEEARGSVRLAWKKPVSGHSSRSLSISGSTLLRQVGLDGGIWRYTVFDAGSGERLWTKDLPNPTYWYQRRTGGSMTGMALSDPYLAIVTSWGVHIYRKPEGESRD